MLLRLNPYIYKRLIPDLRAKVAKRRVSIFIFIYFSYFFYVSYVLSLPNFVQNPPPQIYKRESL